MKNRCHRLAMLALILATGCSTFDGLNRAARGRRTFTSMQAAVSEAAESARDAVVLVKLKGANAGNQRTLVLSGNTLRRSSGNSTRTLTGILLTADGYAVVPGKIGPDDMTRMEAWIGDDEYKARVVKSDAQLGMTIIKIDIDEELKALDIDASVDLQAGEWCAVVQPSDENHDYEQFTSLALCRGQVAGLHRTFLLDNADGLKAGAPVIGMSGKVAGILQNRGSVIAMSDLQEDLLVLLDDARGVSSADEEAKQKAWFGAILTAINKEYARKHELNKSGIWARYVIKDGPAHKAGVKTGDLLVRVNGRDLRLTGSRAHSFFMNALHPKVGKPFSVTVIRDGREIELSGTFTSRPEDETVRADDLGVTVKRIEDGDVATRNLFTSAGVYVTDVKKGSAAAVGSSMRGGLLSTGDIITAVNGTSTPDLDTFSTVLEKVRRENPDIVLVSFMRGRTTGMAALNMNIGDNGNKGDRP